MADSIERYQQDQLRQDQRNFNDALRENTWAETFQSTPPAEVLRSRLNLADTMDRAMGNKLRLQAQSDVKALNLLDKTARHDEWIRMAPLREERLKKQIASEGAHEAFVQQKDTEAMDDLSGFFRDMGSVTAKPGTPEYQQSLNDAIQRYPRIIGTQAGSEALKNLQREHRDLSDLTVPPGHQIDRYEQREDGGWRAVTKPIPVAAETKLFRTLDEGMGAIQGATREDFQQRKDGGFAYSPKGQKAQSDPLERERSIHLKMLDRAKRIRATAKDEDVIKDADADILESEAALADVSKRINEARGGIPGVPAPIKAAPVVVTETTITVPKVGEIRDGWRFKGGNPADKSNWEK